MSILSGLNIEKMKGFLSPGTKETVHNNEVSVLGLSIILESNGQEQLEFHNVLLSILAK